MNKLEITNKNFIWSSSLRITRGIYSRGTKSLGSKRWSRVSRLGVHRLGVPTLDGLTFPFFGIGTPTPKILYQKYSESNVNRLRSWTKVPLVLLIWWPFLNLKPTLVHINVLTYLNTFLFWGGGGMILVQTLHLSYVNPGSAPA